MPANAKKYLNLFLLLILLLVAYLIIDKFKQEQDKAKALEPIIINLITSVHPDLPWIFKAKKSKVIVTPGEVVTIEYFVESTGKSDTTGIATFAYYPKMFGTYISKLNCFCYDAQTLKANEKTKYAVVLLIDPEVTKNSKTKNIKEVTIQFTFFDYNKYKEIKT